MIGDVEIRALSEIDGVCVFAHGDVGADGCFGGDDDPVPVALQYVAVVLK